MKRDSETQVYAPPELILKGLIGSLLDLSNIAEAMADRLTDGYIRIDEHDELILNPDRIDELPGALRGELNWILSAENRAVNIPEFLSECIRHLEQRGSKSLTIPMQKLPGMPDGTVHARSISELSKGMNGGDR